MYRWSNHAGRARKHPSSSTAARIRRPAPRVVACRVHPRGPQRQAGGQRAPDRRIPTAPSAGGATMTERVTNSTVNFRGSWHLRGAPGSPGQVVTVDPLELDAALRRDAEGMLGRPGLPPAGCCGWHARSSSPHRAAQRDLHHPSSRFHPRLADFRRVAELNLRQLNRRTTAADGRAGAGR